MNRRVFLCGLTVLPLGLAAAAAGPGPQDWSNWRGPHFNGFSDEKGLPGKFSPTEGVKWSAALPGPSAATPVICGDNVYLSAADMQNQKLFAMCFDRATGKLKWQHDVGSGYRPAGRGTAVQLDDRSNYASPSPVTDGERVVFFYGNGDLVAFDPAGTKLWARNMQKENGDFCFGWTFSSSPQLYEGKLYFQLLQRNRSVGGRGKEGQPSWLIALNPADGRELWRAERPAPAKMESLEAFTTPIPFEHNGRKEILISGGDVITGHDPSNGKELWRWGTWNRNHLRPDYRLVPSPVGGGGVVLACGPKREPVFAVKAGSTGDAPLAWSSPVRGEVTTDVPTPAFAYGKFYILSDLRKNLSCVDPADGKVLWSTPIDGPSPCWASPTVADGKVYLLSLRGEAFVVDANDGKLLSRAMMAEEENEIRSSIAVARGNLFLRTNSKLFCIGK